MNTKVTVLPPRSVSKPAPKVYRMSELQKSGMAGPRLTGGHIASMLIAAIVAVSVLISYVVGRALSSSDAAAERYHELAMKVAENTAVQPEINMWLLQALIYVSVTFGAVLIGCWLSMGGPKL